MVPLCQDESGFQAAAEFDEDIVEGLLVADLGEPQRLSFQKGRRFRRMPGADLFKGVFAEVSYAEELREVFFFVTASEVALEA